MSGTNWRVLKVLYYDLVPFHSLLLLAYNLLVSVQTPIYSTRAFWKKRPMNRKFDHCASQKDVRRHDVRHQWSL